MPQSELCYAYLINLADKKYEFPIIILAYKYS